MERKLFARDLILSERGYLILYVGLLFLINLTNNKKATIKEIMTIIPDNSNSISILSFIVSEQYQIYL